MRHEKKYRIEDATYSEILHSLITSPAAFKEAFPDRWVNSIYYDDVMFSAFHENLAGISKRLKHRIRWYGKDIQIANKPKLELKIKNHELGTKEFVPVPDFKIEPGFDASALLYNAYPKGHSLHPVVLVRYLRTYLESYDHKFRATIDRELQYYLYQGNIFFQHSPTLDPALILEVKFAKEDREEADYLLQKIPFRLTKNSKYVSGVIGNY
ncbi:MAG: polyphosphate polymerase domain-containing protein [Saprospiraceae bacterium]